MSKCKKYVKGGGINPFWVMEQQGKYDKPSNDFNGSSAAINININIGDFHLDGGFNFDKKNPQNDLEMDIRKVTKDS